MRPYGLTRPVVPPDGSFLLSAVLRALASFERRRPALDAAEPRENQGRLPQRGHADARLDGGCRK